MIQLDTTVLEEPAMVMGFLTPRLHGKLRRMAAEQGCSETALISMFLREALSEADEVPSERQ